MPIIARTLAGCFSFFLLLSCHNSTDTHLGFSRLEQIRHEGVLHVVTRMDPTTYYEGPEGLAGLEYELITRFARFLGVKAQFTIPDTFEEILEKISRGEADIAAAGLTVTAQRKQVMRFAPPYQTITEQVIYRSGKRRPRDVKDLNDGILEVVKGSSHEGTLVSLRKKHPDLEWNVNTTLDSDSLLYLVHTDLIDYTIADSHQAAIIRNYYPKLAVAFDISEPRQLAWALSLSDDDSLYDEVVRFFKQIKQDNTLQALLEKQYGHTDNLNYVGNCMFREHVRERLPLYEQQFKDAADLHEVDWRLLAAIGYQESHWDEKAVSPTGVRGLMMLTSGTARQLGIEDRTDPMQSITGGALYFKQRLRKIPERISDPDRTWLALASYNVGFGHLEDARKLTKIRGGDPDKWIDVKQNLPLLSVKKWYKKTKYGFARGREPVRYVENVRSYYDLLVWLSEADEIKQATMPIKQKSIPFTNVALDVNSPVL